MLIDDKGVEVEEEVCIQNETEIIIFAPNNSVSLSLVTLNSCGAPEIITSINSRRVTDIGRASISVSPELNNLLQEWAYQDNVSLVEYLRIDETISIYEKVAFYQEYALGDAPISSNGRFVFENNLESEDNDIDINNDISKCFTPSLPRDTIVPTDPLDEVECHCEVLTVNPNHLYGTNYAFEIGDGYFNSRWDYEAGPGDTNGKNSIPGQTNASWWIQEQLLGASAWVQLVTEGWKSKPNQFKEYNYTNGDGGSSGLAQGYIALHLLCANGNGLPEECDCSKSGTVSYYYESLVAADSEIKSSGGSRQGKASVQNQAMAFFYENEELGANINGFIPVQGIDLGAASECEATVNPAFFEAIEGIASSAISIFTGSTGQLGSWQVNETICIDTISITITEPDTTIVMDSSGNVVSTTITPGRTTYETETTIKVDSTWMFAGPSSQGAVYQQLLGNVMDVILQKPYNYEDCSSAIETGVINMEADFTLNPNKTLNFYVISSYNLNSGGKRSWSGEAKLSSSYFITAHVKPGNTNEQHSGCCIPHVGAYLIAPGFWESDPIDNHVSREAWVGLHTTFAGGPTNTNGLGYNPQDNNIYLVGNAGFVTRNPIDSEGEEIICNDVEIKSPWHPRLANPFENIDVLNSLASKNIIVSDILGRILLTLPNDPNYTKEDINRLVLSKANSINTGSVLIINYITKNGINETIKLSSF